eukprot:TRINITY_DN4958_c0_g1_i3.p2 TRINITY_DN4958_c0_g1~~TRINITY_DN4958_c0_g1_i3.p2  ORF type:complete len:340 (+),score=73.22 TRINITY_DN4958_c0_g1_i3:125-1144(+)
MGSSGINAEYMGLQFLMEGKEEPKKEEPTTPVVAEAKQVPLEEQKKVEGEVAKKEAGSDKKSEDEKDLKAKPELKKEEIMAMLEKMDRYAKDPKSKGQISQMKSMLPLFIKHAFWDTQPVMRMGISVPENKLDYTIEKKEVKDIKTTPYPLPEGFYWSVVDLANEGELSEVFDLLKDNYIEDSTKSFRYKIEARFLKWALTPPGYVKDWILGVRINKSKKLVGFISGVPSKIVVDGMDVNMARVSYLCVHSKLRTKRMAPVLIKEITRRINLKDVWQGIYATGIRVPSPVSESSYYIFLHQRLTSFAKPCYPLLGMAGFLSIAFCCRTVLSCTSLLFLF